MELFFNLGNQYHLDKDEAISSRQASSTDDDNHDKPTVELFETPILDCSPLFEPDPRFSKEKFSNNLKSFDPEIQTSTCLLDHDYASSKSKRNNKKDLARELVHVDSSSSVIDDHKINKIIDKVISSKVPRNPKPKRTRKKSIITELSRLEKQESSQSLTSEPSKSSKKTGKKNEKSVDKVSSSTKAILSSWLNKAVDQESPVIEDSEGGVKRKRDEEETTTIRIKPFASLCAKSRNLVVT